MGLHLYDGLFKVVPVAAGGALREAYNMRLEELQVVDLVFLHGCAVPTVCLLYQDTRDGRHMKTYEVNTQTQDFEEGPLSQPHVGGTATMLIPVPLPMFSFTGRNSLQLFTILLLKFRERFYQH